MSRVLKDYDKLLKKLKKFIQNCEKNGKKSSGNIVDIVKTNMEYMHGRDRCKATVIDI